MERLHESASASGRSVESVRAEHEHAVFLPERKFVPTVFEHDDSLPRDFERKCIAVRIVERNAAVLNVLVKKSETVESVENMIYFGVDSLLTDNSGLHERDKLFCRKVHSFRAFKVKTSVCCARR